MSPFACPRARTLAFREPRADVIDEIGRRRSGAEQLARTETLELVHVFLRDDSAAGDQHVVAAGFAEQVEHAREQRHVRPAQDREPDDVRIFLDGGVRDHLRRLMEARVDDLHPGVAERGRDDLRSAIVAVEAGFCDQNAYWAHRFDARVDCYPLSADRDGLVWHPKLANAARDEQRRGSAFLARHEQHFAGAGCERARGEAVVCGFDDQSMLRQELGQVGCRIQTNAVLALT